MSPSASSNEDAGQQAREQPRLLFGMKRDVAERVAADPFVLLDVAKEEVPER